MAILALGNKHIKSSKGLSAYNVTGILIQGEDNEEGFLDNKCVLISCDADTHKLIGIFDSIEINAEEIIMKYANEKDEKDD